jgi:hypothetical protein
MGPVRSLGFSVGGPPRYQVTGDPRDLWPREAGFRRWLASNPGLLADCLGVPGIEFTGQEVPAGERAASLDVLGRQRWDGGVRVDLTARDAAGRVIVIEAQIGAADHDHLGKLMTYAAALRADIAVWAVAAMEPPFLREHLEVLGERNEECAGRRLFAAVTVTLESDPSPVPLPPGVPLTPRMRQATGAPRDAL